MDMRIWGDDRGQSEVIGAILIFSIIVSMVGINQAFLVPQANQDVELKHSQDVQRDLIQLRSGVTEAAASNEPRARSIELGTTYPTRYIAINPPPVTGTIQSEAGDGVYETNADLDLSRVCGTEDDPVDTQHLQYRANYHEFNNGLPAWLDNAVTYRDTGNGAILDSGQILVQGDQINIVRFTGDVQRSSSGTTSLDLIPSATGATTVTPSSDLELTIPTRLNANDWQKLIDSPHLVDSDPIEDVSDDETEGVKIKLKSDVKYTVRCTTIGINEEPDVDPDNDLEDGDGDGGFELNPNDQESVVFRSAQVIEGGNTVEITFENRDDDARNMTEARVAFYDPDGQGGVDAVSSSYVQFPEMTGSETTPTLGPYTDVTTAPISDGETTTFDVGFFCDATASEGFDIGEGDYFALSVLFENGDNAKYFIQPTGGNASPGNNPCGGNG